MTLLQDFKTDLVLFCVYNRLACMYVSVLRSRRLEEFLSLTPRTGVSARSLQVGAGNRTRVPCKSRKCSCLPRSLSSVPPAPSFLETGAYCVALPGLELHRPGWPGTHRDLSASAPPVLGLKACNTAPCLKQVPLNVCFLTIRQEYKYVLRNHKLNDYIFLLSFLKIQGLAMQPRLATTSPSSHFSPLNAGLAGVCHHTQFCLILVLRQGFMQPSLKLALPSKTGIGLVACLSCVLPCWVAGILKGVLHFTKKKLMEFLHLGCGNKLGLSF